LEFQEPLKGGTWTRGCLRRGTFGPKRVEVMGGWRKLHNEELRDLYCIITIMKNNENNENNEMDRACSTNGGEEERI
jgi:hypothetical protein